MPRHGFIPDEDLSGRKFYDARLVKRLAGFAKPYVPLMVVAFALLAIASVVEIYLPYLSKRAIDEYIVVNYQLLCFGENDSLKAEFIGRYGGVMFVAGEDSFLIDGSLIDPADMRRCIAAGVLAPHKYMVISLSAVPAELKDTVARIAEAYPQFFQLLGAAGSKIPPQKGFRLPFRKSRRLTRPDFAIAYDDLKLIPRDELKVLRGGSLSGLFAIAALYFGLLAASFAANFGRVYSLSVVAQRVMHDIRVKLFSHLQRLSLRFFDQNPVGRLVTRSTNDVNTIAEMFTSVAVNLFKDIVMLFGIGAVLVYMNWKLSVMVMLFLPVIAFFAAFFRRHLREAYRWVRRALASVNARLSEDFAGIRIVQAFVQEKEAQKRFEEVNTEYYRATMRMLTVNAVFRPSMSFFADAAVALIIWYGGGQVVQQAMSLGMLVAFLSYIRMFFQPIVGLSEKYSIMQAAMAALERIFGLLDTEPEIKNPKKPYSPPLESIRGKVEFRNVSFAYKEGEWVLRDVSFVVPPGGTVALVGATGAGKTTITALLARLYDVQRGQILVDDVDVRDWDITTLRRAVGVVLQDVFLFSTNIRENIRLENEEIDDSDVRAAARIVNAEQFIQMLPRGYDEPVAERGASLSAGQRQLLSFARALVYKPKILVLDEATANIDTHTEALIQDAVAKLLAGRTAIVVAHRLSTIRHADEILVMHKGRIVERGTHNELMKKGGYYAHLYNLQFRRTRTLEGK